MFKLMSKTKQDTLPDARECFKLKYQVKAWLVGGIPLALCVLLPIFLNSPLWLYAICIVIGGIWLTIAFVYYVDVSRDEYQEEEQRNPCPNCGYSLIGLSIPQCPECGVVFFPFEPPTNTEEHDEIPS